MKNSITLIKQSHYNVSRPMEVHKTSRKKNKIHYVQKMYSKFTQKEELQFLL